MSSSSVCVAFSLRSTPTPALILLSAIVFYDYMLTFGGEIELFWKRQRRSWPFVLFVAVRYITIMGHFPAFAYSFLHVSHGVSLICSICLWIGSFITVIASGMLRVWLSVLSNWTIISQVCLTAKMQPSGDFFGPSDRIRYVQIHILY